MPAIKELIPIIKTILISLGSLGMAHKAWLAVAKDCFICMPKA
jgi:hypothetical protein